MGDVKLTKPQRELLGLLAEGPRDGITDARIAVRLSMKGLAWYQFEDDTWSITNAGRAALLSQGDTSNG